LPPALDHTENVPGWRSPWWIAQPLGDDQLPAVAGALASIEERLQPPRREWIIAILSRLAVHYPNASADPDAFAIVLSDMADDLADYSEAHLVQACGEWRRDEKWFPKTCELRTKLCTIDALDRVYRRRARVLLGREEARWYDRQPPSDHGEGAAPSPERLIDLDERLKTLPAGLAESVRGLIAAAKGGERPRIR
jgi:hypothetical protein